LINRCSTAGNNPFLDETLEFHKRQAGIIKWREFVLALPV
jgi:hypothetical protein